MKRIILLLVLSTTCLISSAQQPIYNWAKNSGEIGQSIACDASGNVFVTGWFSGTVDFDPGAGVFNLVSAGSTDVFLSKYNSSGNFLFAKRIGGIGVDIPTSIKLNSSGDVAVAGSFTNTVDFDPGSGNFSLVSSGNADAFVALYSPSGTFKWALKHGGPGLEQVRSLACDASGDIFAIGHFEGTVDFDPTSGINNITSNGGTDIFYAKYGASGILFTLRTFGGTDDDYGLSICTDSAQSFYITGSFRLTADFNPGFGSQFLTSSGSSDLFVAQYTSAGTLIWIKKIGGTGNETGENIFLSQNNKLYLTGLLGSSADVNTGPGVLTFTPNGSDDSFFILLDNFGNFKWAQQLKSSSLLTIRDMTADINGNICIAGAFEASTDFDPGSGISNLNPVADRDAYYAKYTSVGNYIYAKKIGSVGSDGINGICSDLLNNLVVVGGFGNTADFDPSSSIVNLTPGANFGFIAKYSHASPLPVKLILFEALPEDDDKVKCFWTTLTEVNNDYFTLERSANGEYFEEAGRIVGFGNSTTTLNYEFTDEHPLHGTSYYRLKQTDFDGRFTYSQIVSVKMISKLEIVAYPNPATTSLHLIFNSNVESKYAYKLIDVTGKICLQQEGTQKIGMNAIEVNTSMLNKGIYNLVYVQDENVTVKNISIL